MDLHDIVAPLIPPVAGAATALCTRWFASLRDRRARPKSRQLDQELAPVATPSEPESLRPRFVFSSFLLERCRERLTRGNTEHVIALSGVIHGNLRIPTMVCPLKYERVSPVEVVADFRSSHGQLSGLSRIGHRLLVIAHSHPGVGVHAVRESHTDLGTQDAFESAGYGSIGLIVARDGFLNFFSSSLPFDIEIYGNGVEEVADHVFRVVRSGRDVHLPVARSREGGRGFSF